MNELAHIGGTDEGLRELALFAGAGGGILGGHLLGWRCVCAVEWEPYPAAVLAQRQNEGFLPPFPIWDDVRTFDGKPWRGIVDVVSGGFPCQDISAAGKGAGITGERSGMWKEMARIIGEVRPRYVLVENSPVLTSRGLGVVLGDLAALGYDAEWDVFAAKHVGAPHIRERIWILANTGEDGQQGLLRVLDEVESGNGPSAFWGEDRNMPALVPASHSIRFAWADQPDPPPMVDGVAVWFHELAASGNGQVPAVVRLAWNTLYERITHR